LRNQVDLTHDARVTRVARQGGWLIVTARDRSGQTDGEITLVFAGPNAELRSWDVVDATGARTRITLSGMTQPASFDGGLFRLEDILSSRSGPRH
jgi:outer membrane lipoprotein-sorting protein